MSDHPIIIVKRRGAHEEEHHGGAWKIAFADFMTAMMAFFLVLWIINATDKNTKTIIARYFNPVKLENAAKSKKGIHGGEQPTSSGDRDATESREAPDAPAPQAAPDPAAPKPTMSEGLLFADPYRSLDAIAAADKAPPQKAPAGDAEADAFRDPFRPAARDSGETAPAAAPAPPPTPPHTPSPAPPAEPAPKAASASAEAAQLLAELHAKLAASGAAPAPAIDVKRTDEGLLISLTDRLDFAMFPVGSAEPQAKVIQAMQTIATALKARPGAIVLRGHTDARPYRSATYDNWRLSAARAEMAYYMLTRAGLPENRFERIEGYADRRLRDEAHPQAAENRRIEILLREAPP